MTTILNKLKTNYMIENIFNYLKKASSHVANKSVRLLRLNDPMKDNSGLIASVKWDYCEEDYVTLIIADREYYSRGNKKVFTNVFNFFNDKIDDDYMHEVSIVNYSFTPQADEVINEKLKETWKGGGESKLHHTCIAKLKETYKDEEGEFDIEDWKYDLNVHALEYHCSMYVNNPNKYNPKFYFKLYREGGHVVPVFINVNTDDTTWNGNKMQVVQKEAIISSTSFHEGNKDAINYIEGFMTNDLIRIPLIHDANRMRREQVQGYINTRQSFKNKGVIQEVLNAIDEKTSMSFDEYVASGGSRGREHHLWVHPINEKHQEMVKGASINEVIDIWVNDGFGNLRATDFKIKIELPYTNANGDEREKFLNIKIGYGGEVRYDYSALQKAIDKQGYYFQYEGSVTYVAGRGRYGYGSTRLRTSAKIKTLIGKIKETFDDYDNEVRVAGIQTAEREQRMQERDAKINTNVDIFDKNAKKFNSLLKKSAFYFVEANRDMEVSEHHIPKPERSIVIDPAFDGCPSGNLDAWVWRKENYGDNDFKLTITLEDDLDSLHVTLIDLSIIDTLGHELAYTGVGMVKSDELEEVVVGLVARRKSVRIHLNGINAFSGEIEKDKGCKSKECFNFSPLSCTHDEEELSDKK